MLTSRDDIDLNQWYRIEDITAILTMQRYKVRAVLAEHKAVINKGLLLPNLVRTGKGWQITGRGLITLLDILGKALPITKKKGKRANTMARKTFTQNDNPALKFLSDDVAEQQENIAEQKQEPAEQEQGQASSVADAVVLEEQQGKQINPLNFITPKKEKRTARLQLVLTPSLLDEVKQYAKSNGLSVNDFVYQLLENVLHK